MADCGNDRIQVFSGNGKFLSKFGEKGSLDHQLKAPHGLSITRHGDIIVADRCNKLIKINLAVRVHWLIPCTVSNRENIL